MCCNVCFIMFICSISILVMSTHCLNIVNKVINCNVEFGLILISEYGQEKSEN